MLLNNLYSIQEKTESENGLVVTIQLNPEHFVYRAHFPDHPVTPGVYLLQVAKEIMSIHFNERLKMDAAKNVKFLQILSPVQNKSAIYKINWKMVENCYDTSITVEDQSTVFVKINACFSKEE